MKVILNDNIKGVGKKDEIINVSDGYANNFLFPKNLAVESTKENINKLKIKKQSELRKKELEKKDAMELVKKIDGIVLKIKVKSGENGKIFGGVTSKEISENLNKQYAINIDKKRIDLKETIKNLGMINIDIKIYEGIIAKLKIHVISD